MIHHGGMLITDFRQNMKENVNLTTTIIEEMSDEDISKLVHDLWNRQVELEVQNEELRQAHTRLETSQQKYVELYDFAPIGYCTLTKDGFILEANLTIADQVGLERDQLINTQFHHYLVEEDNELFFQHLRSLFETKSQQMCFVRLLKKNNEHFYVRLESRPVDAGDYVYQCRTAIIDVSERKQTENHLKENEERLLQVIQDLPVMIAAFDDHFNFTLWNRECEQVTGYSSEEIVGNPHAQALLYPDPNYRQDILSAIIERGKFDNVRNGEWEITCKNGRIKTIAWFNMVKHYPMAGWYRWTIGVDITERKRTEEGLKQSHHDLERLVQEHITKLTQTTQQLQQETAESKRVRQALQISERQYRLLAENVTDGIAIVQEERLIFTNKALTSMLGFTGNELLGRELLTLIHEDCREPFKETLEQPVKNQTTSQHFQVRWVTKAGREIWIEGEHSMIEWEGKPGILMTVRDITERKQREIALEQEKKRLQKEIFALKSSIKDRYRFGDIIGKSPVMQNLYEQILKAAKSDANVFIYGESGTGKELIARTIHKLSKRHDQRFIPVNCSAIPEALFESEFFGHRRGSFTGAFRDKQGFFTVAHQGTLFLDELGELPPTMQVKLLRVLDDGEYIPIGETTVKKVEVRIIAATNRNVEDMRKRGLIREDFFFRLHVFAITAPPLRERKEDIPLLVDHFVKRFSNGESFPTIPANVMEMLYNYDWPGNVREFQNAIQRYLSGQPLDFIDSRKEEPPRTEAVSDVVIKEETREIREVMDDFEKKLILSVLEQYHWNKSKAAAKLGIPRRTLYRKMEKYGII